MMLGVKPIIITCSKLTFPETPMIHLLFLSQSFAADECDSKIPAEIFGLKISEAKERLEQKDSQQFMIQVDKLNSYVPCLIQPITPEQAAGYHLYTGIQFFLKQKESTAQLHFSAAKATNHTVAIPTSIFPEGHQLHSSFDKAPGLLDTETIQASEQSVFFFDGVQTNERPLYRPSIFQQFESDDLKISMVLQAGEKLACSSCVVPESLLPQNNAVSNGDTQDNSVEIAQQPKQKNTPVEIESTAQVTQTNTKPKIYLIGAGSSAALATASFLMYRNSGLELNSAFNSIEDQTVTISEQEINALNTKNKIGKSTFILSSAATLGFGLTWVLK